MSGFLLDTNAVSMLSPATIGSAGAFVAWLDRIDRAGALWLPVVTIHEIEKGIALLRHKGATAKAAVLDAWLNGLVAAYNDRILQVDAEVAAMAGRLEAKAISAGYNPGMADATVAGIAMRHKLVVVTRNIRHFLPLGVQALAPDDAATMA